MRLFVAVNPNCFRVLSKIYDSPVMLVNEFEVQEAVIVPVAQLG